MKNRVVGCLGLWVRLWGVILGTPATYWGTYGEIPIKKEVSDVPKITANGQLTLPKVSKQNADCVAGKIPPGSKSK